MINTAEDMHPGEEITVDGIRYRIIKMLDKPFFKETTHRKVRRYYLAEMVPWKAVYQMSQSVKGIVELWGVDLLRHAKEYGITSIL